MSDKDSASPRPDKADTQLPRHSLPNEATPLGGVVAVMRRRDQFLMIQRGLKLDRAPGKFCFPGGTIEPGESPLQALHREMQEELGIQIQPHSKIWTCHTTRGVQLEWWATDFSPKAEIRPCPHEIAWHGWMELEQILRLDQLLPTNLEFLRLLQSGEIRWP